MRTNSIISMRRKGAGNHAIVHAKFKLKAFNICCSIIPFLFALFFCYYYWGLLNTAKDFNKTRTPAGWTSEISFFDACGGITEGNEPGPLIDTKWSFILAFNTYFYLAHIIATVLLCCSVIPKLWFCCLFGGVGHLFSSCLHLALVIITGVLVLSEEGELCT